MRTLALLLILASGPPALAQVEAKIVGPAEVEAGDLVILDGSRSSNATSREWILVNSNKTFLPVDDGEKCVFSSGKSGEYIFVLVVAGLDNNKQLSTSLARHTVHVKGSVAPNPPPDPDGPPTPPEPKPDPTAGPVAHVLILRDQSTQGQATTQELIGLRLEWRQQFPRGPPHEPQIWEHDDPQPKVKAWAAKFPAGAALPYCFLVDDDGDIVDQFEFTTATDVITRCRTTK